MKYRGYQNLSLLCVLLLACERRAATPSGFALMFEPHEIEFLKANELPRQRWLYSANARLTIDAMIERGLMQPAYGEFGPMVDKGEKVSLFGREVPVQEMTGLYMLTRYGKTLYPQDADLCV